MIKIWNALALFGVHPSMFDPTGCAVVFSIGLVITLIQTFVAIFCKDKRVVGNYSDMGGFYVFFVYIPIMFFISSLELLVLIQASFNPIVFTWAVVIVIVYLLIKAFSTDPERDGFSLFGLTAGVQQQACNLIVEKGYRYPFQSYLNPIWATHLISKKQKKYLNNVKN
jgi:hypothetical protein